MFKKQSSILTRCFSFLNKNDNFTYQIVRDKKIGIITLTNAKKRNALSIQLVTDLHSQFQEIAKEDYTSQNYTKVIILRSEGTVFSAGHDLKEMKTLQDSNACHEQKQMFSKCGDLMTFIQKSLPQIVIAQVHNFATAAGCQLACSCDLLVASKGAKFSVPGIKIGLFCSTPGVALARSMTNQKKAFEMLVTGDPITAEEAFHYGMINQLVDKDEDLEKETLSLAERIAVYSGETLALGKKAFYQQRSMDNLDKAYDFTSSVMSDNLGIEDCKEGLASFTQKRHPHFKK